MSKDCRIDLIRALEERMVRILDKEDAETVITEFTQVLDQYEVTERSTALTVYESENEKALKRYCACLFIDGKSEKTIKQYQRTIGKMTEMLQKSYAEIGAYDIRLFLAYEKSRGVSNRTLENTRAYLSAFFQWMTAEEVIDKNPCLTIKPIKFTDKEKYHFSAVEIDALRSACKNVKERAVVETLLSSGVRVSELVALDVADIDFAGLTVHVRKGKGNKERTAYINEVTRKYLANHINSQDSSGAVFGSCRGHDRMTPSGIQRMLNRIAKKAGVENVHPHRFRRTFATGLAERGMNIQEIQKLLGHSNINTTMEYVCIADEKIEASYKQYIA